MVAMATDARVARPHFIPYESDDVLALDVVVEEKPARTSKGRIGPVCKLTTCFVWFYSDDPDEEVVQKRRENVRLYDHWRYHDYDDQRDVSVGGLIEIHRGVHAGKIVRITKITDHMFKFRGEEGRELGCRKYNCLWMRENPEQDRRYFRHQPHVDVVPPTYVPVGGAGSVSDSPPRRRRRVAVVEA